MITWNGDIYVLLALCEGPPRLPVNSSHKGHVLFDLRLNKRSRHRWWEMSSSLLWRHCSELKTRYALADYPSETLNNIFNKVSSYIFSNLYLSQYILWADDKIFTPIAMIVCSRSINVRATYETPAIRGMKINRITQSGHTYLCFTGALYFRNNLIILLSAYTMLRSHAYQWK